MGPVSAMGGRRWMPSLADSTHESCALSSGEADVPVDELCRLNLSNLVAEPRETSGYAGVGSLSVKKRSSETEQPSILLCPVTGRHAIAIDQELSALALNLPVNLLDQLHLTGSVLQLVGVHEPVSQDTRSLGPDGEVLRGEEVEPLKVPEKVIKHRPVLR